MSTEQLQVASIKEAARLYTTQRRTLYDATISDWIKVGYVRAGAIGPGRKRPVNLHDLVICVTALRAYPRRRGKLRPYRYGLFLLGIRKPAGETPEPILRKAHDKMLKVGFKPLLVFKDDEEETGI